MLTASQVPVAGSAVPLVTLAPGIQAAVSAFGGTIFVGTSGSVTTSTGAPIAGYCPLPPIPPTAQGTTLYAIAAGSGTVATGVILTGPR